MKLHLVSSGLALLASPSFAAAGTPIDECGVLVQSSFCTAFEADSGATYILDDLGCFQIGDRVRVTGTIEPNCISICFLPCIEGVYIESCVAPPGDAYCFGDGSASPCPCNNPEQGGGCANSSNQGASLTACGSSSASADDLRLAATYLLTGQPALLFAGDAQVAGGDGVPFGDGLRCASGNVVRLGVEVPGAQLRASWGPGLAAQGGWGAGDTAFFQAWYRDPAGPCGSTFNLTNGLAVTFQP